MVTWHYHSKVNIYLLVLGSAQKYTCLPHPKWFAFSITKTKTTTHPTVPSLAHCIYFLTYTEMLKCTEQYLGFQEYNSQLTQLDNELRSVMTKAKEEISTFNLHLQPKKALPVHNPQHNNTPHNHKVGSYLLPINFYYYLLVYLLLLLFTFTSAKNNMMTIQTKRKSSIVNKLLMISYMFGKYLCTILAKILKLDKARTHSFSWGGAFVFAVLWKAYGFWSLKILF